MLERVMVRRPGAHERLEIVSGPIPAPGPGEILIRCDAAGINYADCLVRMGLYASARQLHGYPITPGFEVAGHIEALGEGVIGPAPGTRILALTLFGGYASHLVVPATQVFKVPDALDQLQAAAIPTAYLTAWYAAELAALAPGQRILVHSAAGGVGGALVQFARLAGCEVTGVVGSPDKTGYVRERGANAVISRRHGNARAAMAGAAPGGYDAIFDANGAGSLRSSYKLLAPAGRLVVYGFHTMLKPGAKRPSWLRLARTYLATPRFNPLRMTMENRSVMAFNLSFLHERPARLVHGMTEILDHFEARRLTPPRVTCWPLAEVAHAQKALESGKTVGKLVLKTRAMLD